MLLIGYFCLFCTLFAPPFGVWDAWREYTIQSKWRPAEARIERCEAETYRKNGTHARATAYYVRCQLRYEFGLGIHEYRLRTMNDRSASASVRAADWVAQHGPGTVLAVRVNPSHPEELVVESELPIRQEQAAKEALTLALGFAGVGVALIAIGRWSWRRS